MVAGDLGMALIHQAMVTLTIMQDEQWWVTCSLCTLLQRYFDAAEKDKERYMKEYSAYQQTESYKQFMKLKYAGIKYYNLSDSYVWD